MIDKIHQFNFPTPTRFGIGAADELGPYLKSNGLSRPLIVTDPTIAQLDFFKKIVADLESQGFATAVFHDTHKNPIAADVEKGTLVYHDHKGDSVVGIGGGAGLDVARAIVLRIANPERHLLEYDELIGGDQYVSGPFTHFVTLPTTSGTGSEVGRSAIISHDDSKKKTILFHPGLMAKMVFADPALTYSIPSFVTAATGMDALTHNMEAYLAKNYHPMCDGIALEGIRLVFESIEDATHNPGPESRFKMMLASLMGATAFQKGLGVVHSLAHPMSTLLDTHHGLANAINLPYGMRYNLAGFEGKFAEMAHAMGLENKDGETVVNRLFELNNSLGLPTTLSGAGVKAEHLEDLADLAIADFAHPNNPKPVSRADFLKLYQEAL